MTIPELNVYEEQEVSAMAKYLENFRGEEIKTAEARFASTAGDGFNQTEEVYKVLEELEKASFVQKKKDARDDGWEVSGFYDADDAINYLTDEEYVGRIPHPLGSDFTRSDMNGTKTVQQMFD